MEAMEIFTMKDDLTRSVKYLILFRPANETGYCDRRRRARRLTDCGSQGLCADSGHLTPKVGLRGLRL